MSASAVGDAKQIQVTLKTGTRETDAAFYPFDAEVIDNAAEQPVAPQPDGVKIWLKRAADATSLPKTLHGLVELSSTEAYDVTVPVTQGTVPPLPMTANKTPDTSSGPDLNAFSAIGLAFLGGLLLNLMPCVFPVLFLKGLSLVHSSNEERGRQRAHGLVYTAGHRRQLLGDRCGAADSARGRTRAGLGIPAAVSGICGGAGFAGVLPWA